MDWINLITTTVELILVPLLFWGLSILSNFIKSKVKSARLEELIVLVDGSIRAAVSETQQTFVDELKKAGEFTPDKASEAALRALNRAKVIMGERGQEVLDKLTINVNEYIRAKIEEYVQDDHVIDPCEACIAKGIPLGSAPVRY